MLGNQSINQSIWLCISLLLFFSCTKDLEDNFSRDHPTVKRAKDYYLSTGETLKFYSGSNTKSSNGDNTLSAQWEDARINKYRDYVSVEVPLQNIMCETATDDQGREYKVTSRLIVQYNNTKQQYKQFISTKIWLDKIPDLSTFLFSDLSATSYTLIYDLAGNMKSLYKSENGELLPLILNPEFSNEYVSKISVNNESFLFYSFKPLKTKTFPVTGACLGCNMTQNNFVCYNCQTLYPNMTSFNSFFDNIINEISSLIVSSMHDAYCDNQYWGECYQRLAEIFVEAISWYDHLTYESAEDLRQITWGYIPYLASLDQTFYELYGYTLEIDGAIRRSENSLINLVLTIQDNYSNIYDYMRYGRGHLEDHIDNDMNNGENGNGDGENKEDNEPGNPNPNPEPTDPWCTHEKCPICDKCFFDLTNYICTPCYQKSYHLWQDSINRNCPRASRIISFQPSIKFEQWTEIESAFNKMCGIDKLVNTIEGVGANIVEVTITGDESVLIGWNMKLKSTSFDDVAEEFFHAYQRAVDGAPTSANGLSREFEAKFYSVYAKACSSGVTGYMTDLGEEGEGIFTAWLRDNSELIFCGLPTAKMSAEEYIIMMESFKSESVPPYNTMGYDENYGFDLARDLLINN